MLKKFNKFLFGILGTFAVVFLGLVSLSPKTTASALNKLGSYTISNGESENTFIVSGYDDDSSSEYELTSSASTIEEALLAVENDEQNSSQSKTINFDNLVLSSPIVLTDQNYTFSGSISSSSNTPLFVFENATQINVIFSNLTLTNNSSTCLIEISSESNSANITLNNVNFSSTADNCYAIFDSGTNARLSFNGTIQNSCTYLLNSNNSSNLAFDETFSSSNSTIVVPYTAYNDVIAQNLSIENFNKLNFVASDDFYTIQAHLNNSTLIVSSKINVSFNTNGGNFEDSYNPPQEIQFKHQTSIFFPTAENISKDHTNFVGWFGEINLNEDEMATYGVTQSTWYFDQTMLEQYALSNFDANEFKNIFTTNTDDLNPLKSFSSYVYDNKESNIADFMHVKLFAELSKTPTYIAVFEDIKYTITFNSNGGSFVEAITDVFGSVVTAPKSPTKTGFTFAGWFTDNNTFQNEYTFSTMPDTNPTIYAKWNINGYSIEFIFNNGEDNYVFEGEFDDEIVFPETPTKTGYSFGGWFTDNETFENEFNETTLTSSLQLYAKWNINSYYIYFNTNGGSILSSIYAEYGSEVSSPDNPTKIGFTFSGWFTDQTYNDEFVFDTMPAHNSTAYARWTPIRYTLSFVTNSSLTLPSQIKYYGDELNLPTDLTKTNSIFVGWFFDSKFERPCDITTMPAESITLYAKWQDKQIITINNSVQEYNIDDIGNAFKNFSSLDGFNVQYLVNGNWTNRVPTDAGTYDVKITRNEDDTYSRFETTISGGLVITPRTLNFTWLIVVLFAFAFLELIAVIVIRRMKKIKASKTYSVALPLLLANEVLATNQLVLLIISGVLALFGFVMIIYELVSLHRTLPNFDFEASKFDNRKDLKTVVQDDGEVVTIDTRQKETNSNDYVFSTSDIEDMLADKNYFNKESNRKIISNKVNGTLNKNETNSQTEDLSNENSDTSLDSSGTNNTENQ